MPDATPRPELVKPITRDGTVGEFFRGAGRRGGWVASAIAMRLHDGAMTVREALK